MKIDGNRPVDTEATEASRRATSERHVQRSGAERLVGKTGDRVEVSPAAEFVTAAISAAQNAPAIRTDVVERLKQKLEAGEIGQDSLKLADRLIDDLLDR